MHDLKTGKATTLPAPSAGIALRFAGFSPDGKTAYASAQHAGLWSWDVATQLAGPTGDDCVWFASVLAQPIVCSSGDERLRLLDPTTLERTERWPKTQSAASLVNASM